VNNDRRASGDAIGAVLASGPSLGALERTLDGFIACGRSEAGATIESLRAAGERVFASGSPRGDLLDRFAACDVDPGVLGFEAMTSETPAAAAPSPIVLAGLGSVGLLVALLNAARAGSDGYRPRLYLVEPDAEVAAFVLGSIDFAAVIDDISVSLHIGDSWAASFERSLQLQADYALPTIALSGDPSSDLASRVGRLVAVAREAQAAEVGRLRARVESMRRDRSPAWWSDRYERALCCDRADGPLRVLLLSTRYATYVDQAASRLAAAIDGSGNAVSMLLSEPSDDLKMTAAGCLSAHADFDPDLVISINWPRATLSAGWPGGVPSVCWIQDMMPQLLDREVGLAQGPLDFFVGLVHGSLVRDFAYPRERRLFGPTPGCARVFNLSDPVADRTEPEGRFSCDVAYISHQSGSPDRLIAATISAYGGGVKVRSLIEGVAADIDASFGGDEGFDRIPDIHGLCVDRMREALGRDPEADDISRLHLLFGLPYAERLLRHQTLAWARDICRDRGLRFKIFGRGWEHHRSLGEFAAGEVSPGEDLRRAYAIPRCHLHASLCTNAHQRVFECALSGGLMLRRGPTPDESVIRYEIVHRIAELDAFLRLPDGGRVLYVNADRLPAELSVYDAIRQVDALRTPPPRRVRPGSPTARMVLKASWPNDRPAWPARADLAQYPDWSFDTAAETRFHTKSELERAIGLATGDASWRLRATTDHRSRTLSSCTFDRFWHRIVDLVRSELRSHRSPSPCGTTDTVDAASVRRKPGIRGAA